MADSRRIGRRKPPSRAFLMDDHAPVDAKVAGALIVAKLQGCDCDPEITDTGKDALGIGHFAVAHDDWCSLFRAAQAPDN